ncbi:conserved fungal protein, implicated in vesicle trafficking or lipid metabolism [Schizosaccharomyces osmophilus]|uniref:Conserved fungal protein, implicated in vesicle trafficking or lipid metabolism n=1 Tax=Schizosaccharomyces osmophilus TaxID=2545709 RepID=A0AAE9WC21_9SCHI|nr:conserved fungal protein, implicated in vesicle trafficking or lipid metabolism [Schizosaccharomyces osmophilus]WBW72849.1 conserved fungal protein, implicated in vesicle trafficking or lipid metabolism [Schizosaccharomyces osmophilus]
MGLFQSKFEPIVDSRRKRILPLFRANHHQHRPLDEEGHMNCLPLMLYGCIFSSCEHKEVINLFENTSPYLEKQTHKNLDTYELDTLVYKSHIGFPEFVEGFVLFYEDRLVYDSNYSIYDLTRKIFEADPEYIFGLCYEGCVPLAYLGIGLELDMQEPVIDAFAAAACFSPPLSESAPPKEPLSFCKIVEDGGLSVAEFLQYLEKNTFQSDHSPKSFTLTSVTLQQAFRTMAERDFLRYYTAYLAATAIRHLDEKHEASFEKLLSPLCSQFLVSFQQAPSFFRTSIVSSWKSMAALPSTPKTT